jgi:sulfur carrier protein
MIEITVNGERRAVAESASVTQMLVAAGFDCGRVAVAINSVFVARMDYDRQTFEAGDKVDVVAPMAGG